MFRRKFKISFSFCDYDGDGGNDDDDEFAIVHGMKTMVFQTWGYFIRLLHGIAWYCIHAPSKQGRYWEIHPRCPRDFPITPKFWWSTAIHHQGVHRIILPCRQERIDSVKSNPSLQMMIECVACYRVALILKK